MVSNTYKILMGNYEGRGWVISFEPFLRCVNFSHVLHLGNFFLNYRHVDGNHKLIQPYRIVLHGGIDGYSRLIVYLQASTDNKAQTVLKQFKEAVTKYNLPSRVRSDQGLENAEVVRFMVVMVVGASVHNQRIERLWRDVNRVLVSRFLNIFLYLEYIQWLDPDNEIHLMALHATYIPLINLAIEQFITNGKTILSPQNLILVQGSYGMGIRNTCDQGLSEVCRTRCNKWAD